MYIKKNQLGRKISAKGAIAFATREKEKQLKEWRRKNRKRKIRKINLEDDPLGEENWGFVQENVNFDEIKN